MLRAAKKVAFRERRLALKGGLTQVSTALLRVPTLIGSRAADATRVYRAGSEQTEVNTCSASGVWTCLHFRKKGLNDLQERDCLGNL